MPLTKTPLFTTIHPSTYLWAAQSVFLGLLVFSHVAIGPLNLLEVTDLFWPNEITVIWSMTLVASGLALIYFFLRDEAEGERYGITITAKVNLSVWVFASTVWIAAGASGYFIISIFNILFMSYLIYASTFSRKSKRV